MGACFDNPGVVPACVATLLLMASVAADPAPVKGVVAFAGADRACVNGRMTVACKTLPGVSFGTVVD